MKQETTYWLCNEDDLSNCEIYTSESDPIVFTPEVQLFRLESGNFQISEMGSMKAILSGPNYTLIRRDLATFLLDLFPNVVNVKEVTIIRRMNNEEWNNYSEIAINEKLELKDYAKFKTVGLHIYSMFDSLIYVSGELKNHLINCFPNLNGMSFKQGTPVVGG